MDILTIQELGRKPDLLCIKYPNIKGIQIPRVGEYIRIHQKDVRPMSVIVRFVSYTYFRPRSPHSELIFDVTLFVDVVKDSPTIAWTKEVSESEKLHPLVIIGTDRERAGDVNYFYYEPGTDASLVVQSAVDYLEAKMEEAES